MTKAILRRENRLAAVFLLLGILLCIGYLWMCHVYGRTAEMKLTRCIFKVFINLCWMGIAFIGSRRVQGEMKKKTLMALAWYMLGDVLAPANFMVGGVAFGVGNLFITSGYIRQYGISRRQLGVLAIVSAVMVTVLAVTLGADWKVPIIAVYIIILALMYVSSFGNRYYFATVTVFLLSDVLAYFRKMFFNTDLFHDATLLIYYAAILMYCFSFWVQAREQNKQLPEKNL